MTFSAEPRASLHGGTGVSDARGRAATAQAHDPLEPQHGHDHSHDPRGRTARPREEADEHSHNLGLAVVGLDAPAGRATDTREKAPRTESSAPPAAVAAFEAAGGLLRALAAPVRTA